MRTLTAVVLIALIVIAALVLFSINKAKPSEKVSEKNETSKASEKNETSAGVFYTLESVKKPLLVSEVPVSKQISAEAPQYALPLSASEISNWDLTDKLGLSDEAKNMLLNNGFVVLGEGRWGHYTDQPVSAYKAIEWMPTYITVDSMLHVYHIFYDNLLSSIEEKYLYGDLLSMTKKLLEANEKLYSTSSGAVKEAARQNVAFFSVAMKLLDPNFNPPDYVSQEVSQELSLIEKHAGFAVSPIFKYKEDYSQYLPRGHYTRSETLKRYFKAMMWYGRMTFLLNSVNGRLVPKDVADRETLQAALISAQISSTGAIKQWERIYTVTSFFVGLSDDLTPCEYLDVMNKVFGSKVSPDQIVSKINELRKELNSMRMPRIYSGTGNCQAASMNPEELEKCLYLTKGMRVLGQRYVPDSYIMGSLVAPSVGEYTGKDKPFTMVMTPLGPARGFPRGLDVMAVLGSDRALSIIKREGDADYKGYEEKVMSLRKEFSNLTWRTLYWAWLDVLRSVIKERGEGYPTFMRTEAWQDRQLFSALASWTELRHDTILYVKQSYTMKLTAIPPKKEEVYVEPMPEVYLKLKDLTEMTLNGLDRMGVLNSTQKSKLASLASLLNKLYEASVKELSGESSGLEIRMSDVLEGLLSGLDERSTSTLLVADVHTDSNSGQVLEEGVGKFSLMVVAVKVDGKISLFVGPVLTYYEFKVPMNSRLTDEAWKSMYSKSPPPLPDWTSSFISGSPG